MWSAYGIARKGGAWTTAGRDLFTALRCCFWLYKALAGGLVPARRGHASGRADGERRALGRCDDETASEPYVKGAAGASRSTRATAGESTARKTARAARRRDVGMRRRPPASFARRLRARAPKSRDVSAAMPCLSAGDWARLLLSVARGEFHGGAVQPPRSRRGSSATSARAAPLTAARCRCRRSFGGGAVRLVRLRDDRVPPADRGSTGRRAGCASSPPRSGCRRSPSATPTSFSWKRPVRRRSALDVARVGHPTLQARSARGCRLRECSRAVKNSRDSRPRRRTPAVGCDYASFSASSPRRRYPHASRPLYAAAPASTCSSSTSSTCAAGSLTPRTARRSARLHFAEVVRALSAASTWSAVVRGCTSIRPSRSSPASRARPGRLGSRPVCAGPPRNVVRARGARGRARAARGARVDSILTMSVIAFAVSSPCSEPYVSTKSESGLATPIAYESWTSARLHSPAFTTDFAIHRHAYAAERRDRSSRSLPFRRRRRARPSRRTCR